ncbi:hypothetical protein LX77_02721 [Gelidibacter algens]|jgi:hypothetical protein|uniref:Uncharacterized protein n=1 Tax=Gelidibacter algens TaxID=49280 RepID=A0A327S3B0_9FLAO|nr:hypothetical protein LX77_02721 [Gelidibacter algens]
MPSFNREGGIIPGKRDESGSVYVKVNSILYRYKKLSLIKKDSHFRGK